MTRTAIHEAVVAARFDQLHARFRCVIEPADVRVSAVLEALSPLRGRRVLDLGCGKGRFAAHLTRAGAEVIGIDLSASMLAEAVGLDRVRASARRLPFASGTFYAVVAVEIFEHLAALGPVLADVRRVLRPGGVVAIVDKNRGALNARRPWLPALAVKWLDERRGRWMYPAGGPVRERWFGPGGLARRLRTEFDEVDVSFLLSPEESRSWVFRQVPRTRLLTLWTAHVPGGAS